MTNTSYPSLSLSTTSILTNPIQNNGHSNAVTSISVSSVTSHPHNGKNKTYYSSMSPNISTLSNCFLNSLSHLTFHIVSQISLFSSYSSAMKL